MSNLITPKQAAVLSFIKDYRSGHGVPPTLREIASYFNWSSPNAAKKHVDALRKKGFITQQAKKHRAINTGE